MLFLFLPACAVYNCSKLKIAVEFQVPKVFARGSDLWGVFYLLGSDALV